MHIFAAFALIHSHILAFMNCIFCKIRDREIEKEFLYEDEFVMAFYDIHPAKPVHVLVIPKQHIEDFLHVSDGELWGRLQKVAQEMVKKHGLEKKGYRISVNGGGAQDVPHLHVHVMGPMGTHATF